MEMNATANSSVVVDLGSQSEENSILLELTPEEIEKLTTPPNVQVKSTRKRKPSGEEAFAALCQKHMDILDKKPVAENEDEKFGAFLVQKLKLIPDEKKFEAQMAVMESLRPFLN
jgi:hypothetical protein